MIRLACLLLLFLTLPATAADADLGANTRKLLEQRCGSCHGKVNPQSGVNVLDRRLLLEKKTVVPKQLDQSEMWLRVSSTDKDTVMPPGKPLSSAEKTLIREWIEAGAPELAETSTRRPFVSAADVYAAVEADLRKFQPDERADLRYFTIHHLYNNPTVGDADLRMFRAALSKLVNSLSWEPVIYVPEVIDQHATILRVDLAKIGWDQGRLWTKLLTYYPYGMAHDSSANEKLSASAAFVYSATGSRIPIVRADWFVATAAVPPLYHELLRLPSGPGADRELERQLKVDVERDFQKNRLQRAGFNKSNVSEHNRLVDRHPSAYGAYWKSYDFASTSGRQDLTQFPLGPDFKENEFSRFAFQQDGGEIIFNLPNGLQAYLLIDGKGKRIDKGPINVVFDSKQPLGNKEVINGISCMVCHARGMQPFEDDILKGHAATGTAAQKVTRLYPPSAEFAKVVEQDAQRFQQALSLATKRFLKGDDDILKREPVGAIARQFTTDLFFEDVAAELAHQKPEMLKALFEDRAYRQFGLAVVAQGKVIKRATWDTLSDKQPFSHFQVVSERLGLGVPERVFP
ncbi:MAG: c-type cytochrome domain-containing protein [Planctomycetaceae bacterium]